jgi:hypothetical protein
MPRAAEGATASTATVLGLDSSVRLKVIAYSLTLDAFPAR